MAKAANTDHKISDVFDRTINQEKSVKNGSINAGESDNNEAKVQYESIYKANNGTKDVFLIFVFAIDSLKLDFDNITLYDPNKVFVENNIRITPSRIFRSKFLHRKHNRH